MTLRKFMTKNLWNCTVDVLWGQPIKLIQVVSTSKFHEYWWNDSDFIQKLKVKNLLSFTTRLLFVTDKKNELLYASTIQRNKFIIHRTSPNHVLCRGFHGVLWISREQSRSVGSPFSTYDGRWNLRCRVLSSEKI